MNTENVPNAIIAACVLHNISVANRLIAPEEFEDFNLDDFGMDDDPVDGGVIDNTTKDHIIDQIFR